MTAVMLLSGCGGSSSQAALQSYRGELNSSSGVSGSESLPDDSSSDSSSSESSSQSSSQTQSSSSGSSSTAVSQMAESYVYSGKAGGFWLTVGSGCDIDPSGMDNGQLQDKLDAAVEYAASKRLSTVYLQVKYGAKTLYKSDVFDQSVTGFGFDIVEYLCASAAARKIQVYAVLDLLGAGGQHLGDSNPAAKFSSTLLSGETKLFDPKNSDTNALLVRAVAEATAYPVAGVVLYGLDMYGIDSPGAYTSAVSALIKSCKTAAGSRRLGIIFDGVDARVITTDAAASLTSGTVDAIYPRIYSAVDYYYTGSVNKWIAACANAELYTVNAAYKAAAGKFDDAAEMTYQLFYNSIKEAVDGAVFESYSSLLSGAVDFNEVAGMIGDDKNDLKLVSIDTAISQTLGVTAPTKASVTTTESAYYIMGTSNPGSALTVNGSKVPRYGTKGCFAMKVDLAMGANTFTFRQGGSAVTITITRQSVSASGSSISVITSASRFPLYDLGMASGATLDFTCVGPSGGRITASIGGQTVTMTQVAATAQSGIPATFKGSVTLTANSGVLYNAGVVNYTLTYGGATSTYQSVGRVYVAGSGVEMAVKVYDYFGTVVSDKGDTGSIVGSFKKDSVVEIAGFETISGGIAYKLKDGNYITTNYCTFVTKSQSAEYSVSGLGVSSDADAEYLTFKTGGPGIQPAVTAVRSGNVITMKFYGASFSQLPAVTSSFASSITVSSFNGGTAVKITLKSGSGLWGYNVEYDSNNNVILRLRYTPHLSTEYGKPLSGITIVLDPGHSGNDPGALGPGGGDGPTELTLNVAAANAVKYRLEQLGATVKLTHDGNDGRVYLDARCAYAESVMPDLFISLHHNSSTALKDHKDTNWMECYYFFSESKPLAQTMLSTMNAALGRAAKDPYSSYFYVTRVTFSPAVLYELGFMINAAQYEDCCSSITRYKTACAIADAVLKYIPD